MFQRTHTYTQTHTPGKYYKKLSSLWSFNYISDSFLAIGLTLKGFLRSSHDLIFYRRVCTIAQSPNLLQWGNFLSYICKHIGQPIFFFPHKWVQAILMYAFVYICFVLFNNCVVFQASVNEPFHSFSYFYVCHYKAVYLNTWINRKWDFYILLFFLARLPDVQILACIWNLFTLL